MPVFFFMPTALTATPVAPSLSSGLEFGRANWTAADHAAARASCRFVAGGRAYDLRALAGLTVVSGGGSSGGGSGGGGSGKGGGGVEFEFASPTDLGDSKYSKSSPAREKCASDPDDRAAVRLRLECDEKATAPLLAAGALPFDLVAPCTTTVVVRAAAACGRRTRGALCAPGCEQAWVGDGACDRACLTAECRHDGHDCDGVLWEGAQPRFNVTAARHRGRHHAIAR